MFKPCPKCGFLVALIAGREASQRCPRCGSALMAEGELHEVDTASPAAGAHTHTHTHTRGDTAADSSSKPDTATREASTRDAAGESLAAADARPHRGDLADDSLAADDQVGGNLTAAPADTAPPIASAPSVAPTHDGPSFARRRADVRNGRPRWAWVLGLAALALLLALQLLLAQRVELARNATWRPLVMRACSVLRCTVPAWHEPQAFAMLARGVRPSGTRRGVLHVNATVRNDAHWPQAAPVVVLSLSDVDGRVVGARAVTPAEYGRRGDAGIAPGDSIDIAFDVREPAARVESFDFQLQ